MGERHDRGYFGPFIEIPIIQTQLFEFENDAQNI